MTHDLNIVKSLQEFFIPKVRALPCQEITKSYIVSVFSTPNKLQNLANQSITLYFAEARSRLDFSAFQNLGDWILFAETLYPQSLKDIEPTYYFTIAQISYYNCFKITRRKLLMYEELADQFDVIVNRLRQVGLS